MVPRESESRVRASACLHVVGVAGGDLGVWRDVPEDGTDPVSGPEGERVALVELGVVPVHLGQGQHSAPAPWRSVPLRQAAAAAAADVHAGVGPEVRDGPARVKQKRVRVELDAGAAQRRELPGPEQCGAPRRWIQISSRKSISRSSAAPWNPLDLGGAELRGLVEHDAGGLVAVGAPVFGESVTEQLAGVGLPQVGPLSVLEMLRCRRGRRRRCRAR